MIQSMIVLVYDTGSAHLDDLMAAWKTAISIFLIMNVLVLLMDVTQDSLHRD